MQFCHVVMPHHNSMETNQYWMHGNLIPDTFQCELTSDVLEHKWRASLKTILFYMNDFDF